MCLPHSTSESLPGMSRAAIQAPGGSLCPGHPPLRWSPCSKELHPQGRDLRPLHPAVSGPLPTTAPPTHGWGPWRSNAAGAHRGQSVLTSSFPLAIDRDSGEWPLHSRLVLALWERSSWTTSRAHWEGKAGRQVREA